MMAPALEYGPPRESQTLGQVNPHVYSPEARGFHGGLATKWL